MESLAKMQCSQQPLNLPLNHHRPSFSKPLSSVSYITLHASSPQSQLKFRFITAKSSSRSSSSSPRHRMLQTFEPSLHKIIAPIMKTTFVIAIAATSSCFERLNYKTVTPTPATTAATVGTFEEQNQYPDDLKALWSLMWEKIKLGKFQEAIEIINHVIVLEPKGIEWKMLKAQIRSLNGEHELAKKEFKGMLMEDPFRLETYEGLIMAHWRSGRELKELEKRINEAMMMCKRAKQTKESRELMELIAKIRLILRVTAQILRILAQLSGSRHSRRK